ncbi:MAG: LysE family translocator [Saprospiraceae bacterium]|nr:LysE family translocator [Saprospiraceae bacterium]
MFTHIIIGLAMSFWGSLPIGMISLLVVETTVNENYRKGLWVALGASLVECVQAFIAIAILGLVAENEELKELIKQIVTWIAVPILLYLGWGHLKSDGQVKKRAKEKKGLHSFWKGFIISSLNMLAIPYWLVWGSIFMAQGQLIPSYFNITIFATGVGVGTFLAMLFYVLLGVFAKERLQGYYIWFNRVVGVLFWGLAVLLIIQLLI